MPHQFDCVKMHFSAPLHLSHGREQYDKSAQTLHSDTLAAALFTATRQLGAAEPEALAMLDAMSLSSAFPFWDEEYFFPKPMVRLPFKIKDKSEERQGKSFKKIRYIGKSWFEKVLNGEEVMIDAERHLAEAAFLSDHRLQTVFKADVTQRVTIPSDYVKAPTPFYTERLHFGELAGLYVLVEWLDTGAKDLFQRAFRMLGDLGIGTDRSVGNGFFEPSFNVLELHTPADATHQCALGLYLPKENELTNDDLDNSSWGFTKRGGYIAGAPDPEHITLRKRSVYMFEEGSVFPNKPLTGKRVDLKPAWQGLDYPVWREGRPIFVPIQPKNDRDEN